MVGMDGLMFVCGIVACGLLWDFVIFLLALLEWKAQWEGFKVCRNGAVYNVAAKRFATRAERAKLSCLADFAGHLAG